MPDGYCTSCVQPIFIVIEQSESYSFVAARTTDQHTIQIGEMDFNMSVETDYGKYRTNLHHLSYANAILILFIRAPQVGSR